MRTRLQVTLATLGVTLLLGGIAHSRVAQPVSQSPDHASRETRELRLSLEREIGRLSRVQIVARRADSAQARLSGVSWELADLRSQLARARADIARYKLTVDDYEREFPAVATDAGYAQRMPAYGQARGQLEAQKSLEADLRAREAQLAETVRAEERRWQDALARLDALERELGPSR
jgi:chromosome segregation ATPase